MGKSWDELDVTRDPTIQSSWCEILSTKTKRILDALNTFSFYNHDI